MRRFDPAGRRTSKSRVNRSTRGWAKRCWPKLRSPRGALPISERMQVVGAGLTITDPDHVEAARTMRKAFQNPAPVEDTAALRDLADYDRAFGVVLDDGQVA